ncbi:MAG: hypothetical protein Q4A64_02880 [Porphyromonadaceae bacterium]|nr:hypothetical protein [Porphyromonadaceae bacterium]
MKKKQIYEPPLVNEMRFGLGVSLLFEFSAEGDYIEWGDDYKDSGGGGSSAEIWTPGGVV